VYDVMNKVLQVPLLDTQDAESVPGAGSTFEGLTLTLHAARVMMLQHLVQRDMWLSFPAHNFDLSLQ